MHQGHTPFGFLHFWGMIESALFAACREKGSLKHTPKVNGTKGCMTLEHSNWTICNSWKQFLQSQSERSCVARTQLHQPLPFPWGGCSNLQLEYTPHFYITHWISRNGISMGQIVKLWWFWKYDFYPKIVGPFWDKGTLTCFFWEPWKTNFRFAIILTILVQNLRFVFISGVQIYFKCQILAYSWQPWKWKYHFCISKALKLSIYKQYQW